MVGTCSVPSLFYHHVLRRSLTVSASSGDSYFYSRLLQSSSGRESLCQIHAQITVSDLAENPFLAAKLVARYGALGGQGIADARRVFDRVTERDVLLWNVMIRGYAAAGLQAEAVAVFAEMRRSSVPMNCYTYPFLIKACAALPDERTGQAVHARAVGAGLESDLFVGNALVAFYAKCGDIEAARRVFDAIPVKDLVSWNSMIAGYGQNDRATEAITLLQSLLRHDTVNKPDRVTLVAMLPACAALAAVQEGMWAHSYIIKTGMELDAGLGSGLISMYASCGHLDTARMLFDRICEPNLAAYNCMIQACGMHGQASEALEVFAKMLDMGIAPDGICFVSVLSACSHAGMVHKGFEIFKLMEGYGVEKGQVHYACMVDLLGRAGQLGQAVEFIRSMPVEPERDVWGALLGACRIHNDIGLAEEVAKRLFLLDPENAGRYALLAKMYEDAGRWQDAARLRKAMRDRGVRKPLGCSMVEVDTEIHTFGVEDKSHPMCGEIFDVLEQLQKVVVEEEMVIPG